MPCAHSIDRRARRNGTRRRPERAGRSRRQGLRRPDGHAGERLSRSAAGRIEPAAFVGRYALAAGPTLRHFSPGGAGVQPGQERLLGLSCRSHETEPGGQGAARPRAGPLRRRFASGPQPFGQSAIQLAAVEIAKAIATGFRTDLRDHIVSLDLLGSTIVKHYVAARPQCPACGRKKLRDPAPCAGADRAWRRRQAGHDQRRVPDASRRGPRSRVSAST